MVMLKAVATSFLCVNLIPWELGVFALHGQRTSLQLLRPGLAEGVSA